MNLTVLSLNFPLIWSVFVDLNVFRYCSIEINGNKKRKQVEFFANADDLCTGQLLPGVGKFLCI